jgi:hypothetical protein
MTGVARTGTMTAQEARTSIDRIRRGLENIRHEVLDLYERRGWEALGYTSWRECVVAEFGQSQSQLYEALDAGRVERVLSDNFRNSGNSLSEVKINNSQARELAPLAKTDPEAAREVWREVQEEHGDKVTASKVRDAVQRRKPMESAPPEYACETCGEIHDRPMWHCDGCDNHYRMNERICPECDPRPEPVPSSEKPYELVLLDDARYTLTEARDHAGADTSAGAAIQAVIRNLDNVVRDIRRWRGEQV